MDERHFSTDDDPAANPQEVIQNDVINLLKSIGFTDEWIESFLDSIMNAPSNPEKDKLEADLDEVHPVLDKAAAIADEALMFIDYQLDATDVAKQEWLEQRAGKELELLKINMNEKLNDKDDD